MNISCQNRTKPDPPWDSFSHIINSLEIARAPRSTPRKWTAAILSRFSPSFFVVVHFHMDILLRWTLCSRLLSRCLRRHGRTQPQAQTQQVLADRPPKTPIPAHSLKSPSTWLKPVVPVRPDRKPLACEYVNFFDVSSPPKFTSAPAIQPRSKHTVTRFSSFSILPLYVLSPIHFILVTEHTASASLKILHPKPFVIHPPAHSHSQPLAHYIHTLGTPSFVCVLHDASL